MPLFGAVRERKSRVYPAGKERRVSWKATAFVKELREGLNVTEKFVLLMLAEYHRTDDKLSWPSVATLAADCLLEERSVKRILSRLEAGGFIMRVLGGGRGNMTAYKFIGLDIKKKGDIESVIPQSPFAGETVTVEAINSDRNSDPTGSAIRKAPVLEPVIYEQLCKSHPNSGLTQWGTCWDCYVNKFSQGASA